MRRLDDHWVWDSWVADDGVLGHAFCTDLATWEVYPPLSSPGADFGQMEVAQVKQLGAGLHLPPRRADRRAACRLGDHCTWSVPGASALGPWDVASARPFIALPDLFAAPLAHHWRSSATAAGA